MHPRNRNDFRVVKKKKTTAMWSILYAGTSFVNSKDYESLVELARQLNLDPYYLSRRQTQADRAKS